MYNSHQYVCRVGYRQLHKSSHTESTPMSSVACSQLSATSTDHQSQVYQTSTRPTLILNNADQVRRIDPCTLRCHDRLYWRLLQCRSLNERIGVPWSPGPLLSVAPISAWLIADDAPSQCSPSRCPVSALPAPHWVPTPSASERIDISRQTVHANETRSESDRTNGSALRVRIRIRFRLVSQPDFMVNQVFATARATE